ncbi:hypothetical protein [Rhizobium sp.]|uniref:hypothetical protein n=1 Tax=Rhizobium sp. TaxID=391 RepID=UPI00289EC25D
MNPLDPTIALRHNLSVLKATLAPRITRRTFKPQEGSDDSWLLDDELQYDGTAQDLVMKDVVGGFFYRRADRIRAFSHQAID